MSRDKSRHQRLLLVAGCSAVCMLIASLGTLSADDEPKGKTLDAKRAANEKATAGEEPDVPKAQAVYAALLHATAFLEATPKSGNGWGGTGWVVDAERRLLVTNMHVAGPEDEAEVKSLTAWFPVLKDGEPIHDLAYYSQNVARIPATVIYTDATRDLALIQLASLPDGIAALRLSAQSARVGEPLHSLAAFHAAAKGCSFTLREPRARSTSAASPPADRSWSSNRKCRSTAATAAGPSSTSGPKSSPCMKGATSKPR